MIIFMHFCHAYTKTVQSFTANPPNIVPPNIPPATYATVVKRAEQNFNSSTQDNATNTTIESNSNSTNDNNAKPMCKSTKCP